MTRPVIPRSLVAKQHYVRTMLRRWQRDLERLEEVFGEQNPESGSEEAEMQRNLGTAIAQAEMFLGRTQ